MMQMILKIRGVEAKQNETAKNRSWTGTNRKPKTLHHLGTELRLFQGMLTDGRVTVICEYDAA